MIALQYLRRSSDSQDDSTQQQQRINDEYIALKGYGIPEVNAVWEETGSGRTFAERLVFQAMVKALESGAVRADVLVMYRPSRFGRSEDLDEFGFYAHRLKRVGVAIQYSSGSEYNIGGIAGYLTRTLAYAQAAEFSKDLSNYSTRGLLENARNGYSTGGDPGFGFERMLVEAATGREIGVLLPGTRKGDDRKLKVKYVHARGGVAEFVREHIFERPQRNGWGYAKTARELNRLLAAGEGLPSPRIGRVMVRKGGTSVPYTGTWKASTVKAMWTCTSYIGWRTIVIEADNEFHGLKVECVTAHDPLVTPDVFWDLYSRANCKPWNERKLGPKRRRKPGIYPLSGMGKCVHCAFGFAGTYANRRPNGMVQFYYRDSGETNGYCTAPSWSVPVADLGEWVKRKIEERLRSDHFREHLLELLRARHGAGASDDPLPPLRARRAEVQGQIDNLIMLASRATTISSALAQRLDALEAEAADLDRQMRVAVDQRRVAVREQDLLDAAAKIVESAVRLVQADNELLQELAPKFIREFRVDKEKRTIEVDFYNVPGMAIDQPPGTRIEKVEARGVEPLSEITRPS